MQTNLEKLIRGKRDVELFAQASAMSSAISGNAQRLNSHSFHSSAEGPRCECQCLAVGLATADDLLCVASGTGSQDDAEGVLVATALDEALVEAAFEDDVRIMLLSCF